jgi:hypothetical protein
MNRKRTSSCRLYLEPLEDRCLLSAGALDLAIGGQALAQHSVLQTPNPVTSAQVGQAYGQLPLSFEANQGQTDSPVNFLSRGAGYGLFLTPTEAVLALQQGSADDLLRMQLVGANPPAQPVGMDQLPGVSNYLIGNDPSQWHTNIPNFARVEYQNVYPGINLVYYGNQRQLEYDFVVAPGADPNNIRMAIAGAQDVTLDAQGNLVLHTSGGEVVEQAPVLYQTVNGTRHEVAGRYVLLPGGDSPSNPHQVGFQLGAYDPTKPLVIDPLFSLVYFTYLGDGAFAYGIAVDSAGNPYVTGGTGSTSFPTVNPFQGKNAGGGEVFVTKFNAAGSALVYSTYLGGSGYDIGWGIAVDSAGNASVTGYTSSSNFPTLHALQPTYGGLGDAFVTKLNAAGSGLIYSTYLGGSSTESASYSIWADGIAVDGTGNTYVTGRTFSANFPTTPGAFQRPTGSTDDTFVTKFNPTGSLVYSTLLGSLGSIGYAIAADSSGNAYVTGVAGSNFPTTAGAFQTSYPDPSQDAAFVTKLNPTGSALVYSTYLVSGDGFGIAVDGAGNAYVRGFTQSTNFPTVNAFQTTGHVFVTKLNAAGSALLYSTRLGGSGNPNSSLIDGSRLEREGGIAVDGSGNAYVTGWTNSADFPTKDAFQPTYGGGTQDAFVARFDTTQAGNASLIYSSYLGGSSNDVGEAIAVDTAGNAYVAGVTYSKDFPITKGAYQKSLNPHGSAFVTKIDPPLEATGDGASDTGISMSAAAEARLQAAGVDTSSLHGIEIHIADLGGTMLGLANEIQHAIWLDDNPAGSGWFVDPTPGDDSEFTTPGNQGEQRRMDLLTVLEHELGHVLGYEHQATGVMQDTLAAGVRESPSGPAPAASGGEAAELLWALFRLDRQSTGHPI